MSSTETASNILDRILLLVAFIATTISAVQAQDPNDGFRAAVEGGLVYQATPLDKGRILIGGSFTHVGGVARSGLARLHADGSLDTSFVPPVLNGAVTAFVALPDERVAVAGDFTQVNAQGGRPYLIRIFPDGPLDAGFAPAPDSAVFALLSDRQGRLLVGGSFTQIGGQSRARVARLVNDVPDGFNPGPNNSVYVLAEEADGSVLLGGVFSSVAGQPRQTLARLRSDGTLDAGFAPNPTQVTHAIGIEPDGRLLIGGSFTTIAGQPRINLARLNRNGSLDASFQANADAAVLALARLPDGSWIVGGSFGNVGGQTRHRLAHVHATGVDTTWRLDADDYVKSLSPVGNGQILVGGNFLNVGSQSRPRLSRLTVSTRHDRTLDEAAMATSLHGAPVALALEREGSMLVGGNFSTLSGTFSKLLRMHGDGSFDLGFRPTINGEVNTLVVQADGGIVVGGDFSLVNNWARNDLVRLDRAAALDLAFQPQLPFASVVAMAGTADGQLLVAGASTTSPPGVRVGLVRVNADGSLDPSLAVFTNDDIEAIAQLPNGQILIGGRFTSVNGATRNFLARLNSNGTVDTGFQSQLYSGSSEAGVRAIAALADGRVAIQGGLSGNTPQSCFSMMILNADGSLAACPNLNVSYAGSLVALGDGRLLVAGNDFNYTIAGITYRGIARLQDNGVLDPTFRLAMFDDDVDAVGIDGDGKIVATGWSFGFTGSVSRSGMMRLSVRDPGRERLARFGSAVVWHREGALPEFERAPLLQSSSDGINWTDLGEMTRLSPTGSTWMALAALPFNQTMHLRAMAPVTSGRGSRSRGMAAIRDVFYQEGLFANGFE